MNIAQRIGQVTSVKVVKSKALSGVEVQVITIKSGESQMLITCVFGKIGKIVALKS